MKRFFASNQGFLALVIVMLGTILFPPYMRLLGPQRYSILGLSEQAWSTYVASRGLFFILFVLAAGVLGDFFGRRRVLLLILSAFVFCLLLMIVLPAFTASYLIVYTVVSTLVVMINTLTVTLIILSYTGRTRLAALVIYTILFGAGYLLAPVLTQALGQLTAAKAIYFPPLMLAVVGFWLTKLYIPDNRPSGGLRRQNVIALVVWTVGLCLIMYAGVLSGNLGWKSPLVLIGLAVGGLVILGLVWFERQRLPGRWKYTLFNERELSIAIIAGIILYLALYAIVVQVFNLLNRVQEYNLAIASLALAPILIGICIHNVQLIRWTDRLTPRQSMTVGLVLVAITPLVFSLLRWELSPWFLLPCLLLLGFGFILCNTPRLLLLSSSVPQELAATVQSIGSATAHLGGALAYSLVMTLVAGFGERAYVQTLGSFGLSQAQITSGLFRLAEFGERISLVAAPEDQIETLKEIDFWLVKAYITGLSQSMLVLAALCLFCAALIYIGLYKSKLADAPSNGKKTEEEKQALPDPLI